MSDQQISAKVIAHSKSAVNGKEIITFELEYPRFIHSELMTHRMFSRNAMSSRAVPIEKMIEQVAKDPAMPIHWGKNQAGMQAKEEVSGEDKYGNNRKELLKARWHESAKFQASFAQEFSDHGLHKQVVNRILEPFQIMKTVLTATEFENFFWLRNHADAQPEIKRLAEEMLESLKNSHPFLLNHGEWHLPYVDAGRAGNGEIIYYLKNDRETYGGLSEGDALAISSSCCAQVSYRKLDDSLEKALKVYERLVESEPVHASPFEHQASPTKFETAHDQMFSYMNKENITQDDTEWEDGVTYCDREGYFWSGNFKGWIQHRQLIPNNVKCG